MNSIVVRTVLWQHDGPGGWWFLTLPVDLSEELRTHYGQISPGWGSLPVSVAIGGSQWKTSIFFDTKRTAYLLPIKAQVRKKEALIEGATVEVSLEVN